MPEGDHLMINTVRSGFVYDRCHNDLKPGDVVIAQYRGDPEGRFTVLYERQSMWQIRDPDGVERPMRPSTLLKGAVRVERATSPGEFTPIAYG
jgi:hypothetical protein